LESDSIPILELNSNYVKMVVMVTKKPRTERRTDALSTERIVEAAIEILDAEGDGAQLFRALTTRLSTGVGAIYHHVANKNELLAAAADSVILRVMTTAASDTDPRQAVRTIALGIFDAIDAHPWVGTQLSREPWQPAVLRIWSGIGRQLQSLGITGTERSDAGSTLVNYILGAAAQYAAGPARLPLEADRAAFLATLAAQWEQHDPAEFPLVHEMASQLREHDDREQFLAGVDIFLAGIMAAEH
jgi:AcrR family transcriptional regulator